VDNGRPRTINVGSVDLENLEDNDPKTLSYYELYSEELGAINLLKNMLLVQYYLKCLNINYIIQNGLFDFGPYREIGACAAFIDRMDVRHVCDYPFLKDRVDLAADGTHPGPITHTAIAIHLLDFYGNLLDQRNDLDVGGAVRELALSLKATRPEWAYAEAGLLYQRGRRAEAIDRVRTALTSDDTCAPFGRELMRVMSKPFLRVSPKQMPRYDEVMGPVKGP
jgi:hypothetical protein